MIITVICPQTEQESKEKKADRERETEMGRKGEERRCDGDTRKGTA